jgi:RNA polymerase sigma factor (sigma-70 family)
MANESGQVERGPGYHTLCLQECLARLQAGEEAAQRELIEFANDRFHKLAHFMLSGFPRLRQWVDTDDVWNAALLRLTRALREVRPPTVADLHRFAAACIRRELKDLAKHYGRQAGPAGREQRFKPIPGASDAPEAYIPAGNSSDLRDWSEFHAAAEDLPEREKEVFDLLYYERFTQKEAALALGVSRATVKLRWYEARRTLHDRLAARR